MAQSSASIPVTASPTAPPTGAVCPYLLAVDGRWRSAAPAREHRCTAVAPAAVITIDKQRRLCLADGHGGCATYRAATGATLDVDQDPVPLVARTVSRPLPRTAPLVLDHGRVPVAVGSLRGDRGLAQGALLLLMIVAFAAIVVARLSGPPGAGEVLGGVSDATASPTPSARAQPVATSAAPGTAVGSATPVASDDPTAAPTEGPTTSPRPTRYEVRAGDTLSGIAAEFGTTVRALADLNDIDDPSRLRIGQVLELPASEE